MIDGLATSDISFAHFRTLMVLAGQARALSLAELAEILHLSVAATGRNVDKLVGMGLVDRREDPADRRVKRVSLTDEGHHRSPRTSTAKKTSSGISWTACPLHSATTCIRSCTR